jgi:alanine dehydrogenase
MALHLTEADVRKLFTMPLALETVETSFRRLADGSATNHPRRRLRMAGKGLLNYMAASDTAGGYMGLKIYTVSPSGIRFLVPLFSGKSGELLALIEADFLGQLRTGAASGVATRFMARQDARTLGIIGTGLQARTQLEAVAAVRKLERVHAFGRDEQRRAKFAQEMTSRIGVPVMAVSSAEEAVRGADILVTSTNSREPVVDGRWLEPGMHINAIGVNFPDKRELDTNAVRRCDVIAADSREQSKIESGDLIQVFGENEAEWSRVYDLAQIIAGDVPARTSSDQITLFKSNGLAIEDIVSAGRIYELARQQGIGKEVPMFEGSK